MDYQSNLIEINLLPEIKLIIFLSCFRLTALTKDRSLIDMYARFLKFEDEMTVISVVWREAQQFIDKYEKVMIIDNYNNY